MLDTVILLVLVAAIVPLLLSIFFYVTTAGRSWWRVPSRAWLNALGIQVVGQKTVLLLLLAFIFITRLAGGDFPGRQIIAWALYTALVGAFWTFFIIQRRIQKPTERNSKPMSTQTPTETPNVVIENPSVRKIAGNTLGVAGLLLSIATLVDGAIPQLDYGYITGPAAIIIAGLFGIFQLGVTSPNVPRR